VRFLPDSPTGAAQLPGRVFCGPRLLVSSVAPRPSERGPLWWKTIPSMQFPPCFRCATIVPLIAVGAQSCASAQTMNEFPGRSPLARFFTRGWFATGHCTTDAALRLLFPGNAVKGLLPLVAGRLQSTLPARVRSANVQLFRRPPQRGSVFAVYARRDRPQF